PAFCSGFTFDKSNVGASTTGGGYLCVRGPKRKCRGTNVGSSRGVSALYHCSSHLLTASRVGGFGRSSGPNASSVTVTRLRGAKTNRLAIHRPMPRKNADISDGLPSAQLNM